MSSWLKFVRKNPLLSFVLVNYALSWSSLFPAYQILLKAEKGDFPWLALIGLPGAYGPTLAALAIVAGLEGKRGLGRLLGKYGIWRVSPGWYCFAVLIPVGIYALALFMTLPFGWRMGETDVPGGLKVWLPYFLITLPFGPMGEELGWRGFLLPRLLDKHGILASSLITGLVWTLWHLASFSFPGAALPSVFEVSAWTLFLYWGHIVSQCFLFTFLFLKTRGSVLLAILLHAGFNANSNIVFAFLPDAAADVAQREMIYVFQIVITLGLSFWLFWERSPGREGSRPSNR